MRKYILTFLVIAATGFQLATAQVIIGGGPGYGYGNFRGGLRQPYPVRRRQRGQPQPKFEPVIHLSLGYGYPNLDKSQLAGFYNYSMGTVTQTGPLTGAIDYQYSRNAAIGVMVTHGQVNTSYYDYNNPSAPPVMTGSLDNWSIMVNMMNYLPGSEKLTPYFRTAVGVNIWNQNYRDANGNNLGLVSDPNQLAYQLSLGATINLSKNTGLFMEAGYGKYILHGGLSFRL